VKEIEDPEAYAKAIRDVLAGPEEARHRSRALRERLIRERTPAPYAEQVAALFLALGDGRDAR
jgi:glycosyltransferase involved in cell wall biosynthesis